MDHKIGLLVPLSASAGRGFLVQLQVMRKLPDEIQRCLSGLFPAVDAAQDVGQDGEANGPDDEDDVGCHGGVVSFFGCFTSHLGR